MNFIGKEDLTTPDELPLGSSFWRKFRPFLLARMVDTACFVTLLAGLVIVHFVQLGALALGWFSPQMAKTLDLIESSAAFASIIAYLLFSAFTLIRELYVRARKDGMS
jgi:hypothetical protein